MKLHVIIVLCQLALISYAPQVKGHFISDFASRNKTQKNLSPANEESSSEIDFIIPELNDVFAPINSATGKRELKNIDLLSTLEQDTDGLIKMLDEMHKEKQANSTVETDTTNNISEQTIDTVEYVRSIPPSNPEHFNRSKTDSESLLYNELKQLHDELHQMETQDKNQKSASRCICDDNSHLPFIHSIHTSNEQKVQQDNTQLDNTNLTEEEKERIRGYINQAIGENEDKYDTNGIDTTKYSVYNGLVYPKYPTLPEDQINEINFDGTEEQPNKRCTCDWSLTGKHLGDCPLNTEDYLFGMPLYPTLKDIDNMPDINLPNISDYLSPIDPWTVSQYHPTPIQYTIPNIQYTVPIQENIPNTQENIIPVPLYNGYVMRDINNTMIDNIDSKTRLIQLIRNGLDSPIADEFEDMISEAASEWDEKKVNRLVLKGGRPNTEKQFALSFEEGPSSNTPKLLEILKKYNICCAFYLDPYKITSENISVIAEILNQKHVIGMYVPSSITLAQLTAEESEHKIKDALTTFVSRLGWFPSSVRLPRQGYTSDDVIYCIHLGLIVTEPTFDTNDYKNDEFLSNIPVTLENINTNGTGIVLVLREKYISTLSKVEKTIALMKGYGYKQTSYHQLTGLYTVATGHTFYLKHPSLKSIRLNRPFIQVNNGHPGKVPTKQSTIPVNKPARVIKQNILGMDGIQGMANPSTKSTVAQIDSRELNTTENTKTSGTIPVVSMLSASSVLLIIMLFI
ncbi:hypothetical protein NEOKW01_2064 [Nematocida sp. AWRm80]|nr:hypothetical protein NEOKW01_2064 [Nematocida sp. AWRm80]